MLFCDLALAARIEREERDLIAEACAAVAPRRPGAFLLPIGGGLAAFTEPGSPLNKVVGVGFAGVPEPSEWHAVEAAHEARGVPLQVEVATLAAPELGRMLGQRGYELVGVENVLGLALPARPAADAPTCDVRRCGLEALDTWIDVVVSGFASPDTQGVPSHERPDRAVLERVMREFAAGPAIVRYLARLDSGVAGGAAMRLGRGIAQLCGAATLPAARRRGVQTALLARRLVEASEHGCELAVVTTQPGSKSQQNVMRWGFELLYARLVWVRAPRPATA